MYMRTLGLAALLGGAALTACPHPTDSAPAADKTALNAAIQAANAAKAGVLTSADGSDVSPAQQWVTGLQLTAFEAAITGALAVYDDAKATQADVDKAAQELRDLTTAFNGYKHAGTQGTGTTLDKTALNEAIEAANAAKSGVQTSADGNDVNPAQQWVTEEQMTTFTDAIEEALDVYNDPDATQDEIDEAEETLAGYTETFSGQKQAGKNENAANKTALNEAIEAANAAKSGVQTSADGSDVSTTQEWVTSAQMSTFTDAITAALAVYNDPDATQDQVDIAKNTLTGYTSTFSGQKQAGTLHYGSLVKFNAANAAYDGTAPVSGLSGEAYLVWADRINILSDSVTIEARVTAVSLSGHNGTGFISVSGSARKGYMLLTAQNVKNVGTTGGLGGQGLGTWQNGGSWASGSTYVFKTTLQNGVINHYVYAEDGATLLNSKTGTNITQGHAKSDIVYAVVGGTNSNSANMLWSDLKITYNGTTYVINALQAQSVLPVLSASAAAARVPLGQQATVNYTAKAPGGTDAQVAAVSDDPSTVRVDSAANGVITFTGLKAGSAVITVTNQAATYLTTAITVTVTNFPDADDYGSLAALTYPAAGAASAYTDGELSLTFDTVPVLQAGGSICIYNKATGEAVDVILFEGEKQVTLGSSNNNLNVGDQLVRVEGNTVYFTPHFGALAYGTAYYVAIPDGAISGTLAGKAFSGLSDNKAIASWSFTTRTEPALTTAAPVIVNGAPSATPDFRTVYGALKAIAAKGGDWTINVAPGTYRELVHYVGTSNVTINGTGSAPFGADVIIQYTNSEKVNGGSHARSSFYFSGAHLTLKNITLRNTSARTSSYDPGQAEALYFANGSGKFLAAYNCSFYSHQDTIQTTGRNWFYQCHIEGDTDYIWGTADASLFEECELVSVNDTAKTNNKDAILFVARTVNKTVNLVPKGYVLFNSKVTTQSGMTTYFGRNAGAGDYWDQVAIVDTEFSNEGTGAIGATLWSGSTYDFLAGKPQHIGAKYYNVTLKGGTFNTSGKNANVAEITDYGLEYNGRCAILNRVYNKEADAYEAAASVWDLSALETAFGASPDASQNNDYGAPSSGGGDSGETPGEEPVPLTPASLFAALKGQPASTGGWADRYNGGAGLTYTNPASYTLIDDETYSTAAAKLTAFTSAINDSEAQFIIVVGDVDLSDGNVTDDDHSYFDEFDSTTHARLHSDFAFSVKSDKTIIGLDGAKLKFGGLKLNGVSNVIIRNITFWDAHGSTEEDTAYNEDSKASADALVIQASSGTPSNGIWIDHCTFTDGTCSDLERNYNHDGQLDIPSAKNVTVSWCEFTNHDKVMLVGSSDSATDAEERQVTLHHNYFHGTVQRMPRSRGTQMHIYNNYYNQIGVSGNAGYSLGPGIGSQFIVENNYFGTHQSYILKYFDSSASIEATTFSKFYHAGNAVGSGLSELSASNFTYDSSVEVNKTFAAHESAIKPWTPAYTYTPDAASGLPEAIPSGAGNVLDALGDF
jgi:pectate lyase